jgi:hypothetical protein
MVTPQPVFESYGPDTTSSQHCLQLNPGSYKACSMQQSRDESECCGYLGTHEYLATTKKYLAIKYWFWIHHSSWRATEYQPLTSTNPLPKNTGSNSFRVLPSDRSWSLSCKAFWNSRKVLKKSMDCTENTTMVTSGWWDLCQRMPATALDLHWNV